MHTASIIAAGPARAAIDDCWNRIDVRGDGSCPELKQHVHCSHCPTHAAAALALLDREAPPDYLADCTRHMAQAPEDRQADAGSVVIFRIRTEWLALPTPVFQEVAALPAIHSLPNRRDGVVQGVANVRGELLVCVSLGSVLGLVGMAQVAETGHALQHLALRRLVVIGLDGQRLGFAVDEMRGIARFDPTALKAVPATVARATATYSKAILAWKEHMVGVLDEQLLFYTLERSLA
ncbi:MAG: purine-binding chemotaxis protein CheW [Burkholderiales bacterium]|jgi:chemotaxis-related protein WspD|nr:purine-binding chemotaxis protein CheW [Burkholderiales bacterium]